MLRATIKRCKHFQKISLCKFSTSTKVFSQDRYFEHYRFATNTLEEPVFEYTYEPSGDMFPYVEDEVVQPLEEVNTKAEETVEKKEEGYSRDTKVSAETQGEYLKCSLTGAEMEFNSFAKPLPEPWYEPDEIEKAAEFQKNLWEYGMRTQRIRELLHRIAKLNEECERAEQERAAREYEEYKLVQKIASRYMGWKLENEDSIEEEEIFPGYYTVRRGNEWRGC